MKQFIKLFFLLSIILSTVSVPGVYSQEKPSGQISISGAFALYPMVVRWADEYKKINPGVRFDISAGGAAEMWAKFYGKKQEDLLGVGVFGDPGLAQAVKRDPLGIGYNNIGYAYDATTRKQIKGLKVVPIDLNNNGKIDSDENFYDSMNDIMAAIASGKYPSPPARELYFVMKGSPENNKVLTEFIKWVLSDGQKFVNEAGYISLPKEKIEAERMKLK